MLAFVHDFDPVLFDIWGPLKLRWYGLSYLMAFVVAFFLLRFLSRRGQWVIPESKIGDFIAMLAMFGVFLGGRLGYVFLYMVPESGWGIFAEDPLIAFKVWDGGMASHGGFLGVAIFTWVYARKNKLSWLGIGDGICIVAPLGLLFGRLANFVNGELYGRVTSNVPWAIKFPQALHEESFLTQQNIVDACADKAPDFTKMVDSSQGLEVAVRASSEVKQIAEQYLTARHPSQLYEGALEGVVLFAVMWFLRMRYPKASNGMISGVFFILYGIFRTVVEQFRQPDSALIFNTLTKGQFFSLFMVLAGIAFLVQAKRSATTKN